MQEINRSGIDAQQTLIDSIKDSSMCGGWYGKHRDIVLPLSLPRSRSRGTRIKARDRSRGNRIKRLKASGIEGEWAADQNQDGESGGDRNKRKLGLELRRRRKEQPQFGARRPYL